MIYWLCQPSILHDRLLLGVLVSVNILQFTQHLSLTSHIAILLFSIWLFMRHLKINHQLPIALSYHKDYWRLSFNSEQFEGELEHGFVLGPIAFLRLTENDNAESEYRLWLSYWQIKFKQVDTQGNWRQLVTLIRQTRS